MPKFSVAIAVYNKEKHIASTLQSVLNQTFLDFEIVIVNDGSTDYSEAVIKSFEDPRIRYYYQKNEGAGAARNVAILKSKATYIALLDADDLWHPTYLETIHSLIEKHSGHSVFATAVAIETPDKTILSKYSIQNIEPGNSYIVNYFEASYINTILTSSSTAVHRDVFEKCGNYDQKIKSGQDTDLWIRIGIYYDIVFFNESLVTYRYVPQSLSNLTKDVANKPRYNNYLEEELQNPSLKKFLDLNRYSMALLAKLNGDHKNYAEYASAINTKNLNKKQYFLLLQPRIVLKMLSGIKNLLQKAGIYFSTFG